MRKMGVNTFGLIVLMENVLQLHAIVQICYSSDYPFNLHFIAGCMIAERTKTLFFLTAASPPRAFYIP